jgi:primosomal protein N' (replication factor Y)
MAANSQTQKSLFLPEPERPEWEIAAELDRLVAQVAINRPLETTYDYLVPEPLREMLNAGQRVEVPFGTGNHTETAFCVGLTKLDDSRRRLKSILSVVDREPIVNQHLLDLTKWIADQYLCGWGQVLETAIPAGVKKQAGTRELIYFSLAPDLEERLKQLKLPAKQAAVIEYLKTVGRPQRGEQITDAVGCGTAPISGLRDRGLILAVRERSEITDATMDSVASQTDLELNPDQKRALATILLQIRSGKHRTMVLHGVTGSGKTEVYIQAIREVVSYGRQAIVLVPEISLTPQTIRRFKSRFDSVAVLHSHLTDAERHWHWQRITEGGVQVIVGARSAVFAPTPNLGLIIIDEEHETTFKQDTAPRYNAREVARERARMASVPLILGSATPTLETWLRVQPPAAGEQRTCDDVLLSLPRRATGIPMPPATIVDLRNDPLCAKGHAIGRAMRSMMQSALDDGGQVILFLNLRGFSPTVWCRACGGGIKCPNCDITLTYHKDKQQVLCHTCNYEAAPPQTCPVCAMPGIRYFGIGTQRLEEEVRNKFPNHRCIRMDSDTMKRRGSHDEALEIFRRGEAQILLGTQMIAKGLDFPNVTLVGVVDADTILHQADLRASERTFQLIAQVAGRAGRSEKGGRVLVQTCSPTDFAIQRAVQHDYIGFVTQELQNRHESLAPPFCRWVRVILRGPVEERVRTVAIAMAEVLREVVDTRKLDLRILGPAPCPVAKLQNNYRFHYLFAAPTLDPVRELWRELRAKLPSDRDVEYVIDVDPLNLR